MEVQGGESLVGAFSEFRPPGDGARPFARHLRRYWQPGEGADRMKKIFGGNAPGRSGDEGPSIRRAGIEDGET